jgi:hypothetical protein
MANARNGNTFYVDSSSSSTTSASFISDKSLKLIGIIYHVDTANTDILDLYDKDPVNAAAGVKKLSLISSTAKNTQQIRLENTPLVFPNGVWVTLTGTPSATLIFTTQGN